MQDKDKLFLVVYFGVKSRPFDAKTNQMLTGFYNNLKETLDETVKVYIVPQATTDEVKFELLNVENCSDEKLTAITNIFNAVLDEYKKEN